MKNSLQKLTLGLASLVAGHAALGQDVQANINAGNLAVGGSFSFGKASYAKSESYYNFTGSAQYFVIDRLALGGMTYIYNTADSSYKTVAMVGPMATYYFWAHERLATYVSLQTGLGLTDNSAKGRILSSVGLNYFFTPAVAIGPSMNVKRVFGRNGGVDYWDSYLNVSFDLLL